MLHQHLAEPAGVSRSPRARVRLCMYEGCVKAQGQRRCSRRAQLRDKEGHKVVVSPHIQLVLPKQSLVLRHCLRTSNKVE
jgi:hypothetical protein